MKAWMLDDFTGIESLRLAEVPDPVPGAGEVVLEVHYAGLNPADYYLAQRQYPAQPPLPHILGRDGLGTVVQLGSGVAGVRVGERRAILRSEVGVSRAGTFAQKVAVPAENLIEVPAGWTEEQAAGAPLVYLTAHQALTMWGVLPPGTIVLVTGASGGVGVAAVQLAAAMGYTVIGLSRSVPKSERLRQLGAKATYDPHESQWRQALKELLAPRRVDLAIDMVGGKLLPQVLDTLGEGGRVSLVGRLAGPVPEFNTATMFFRRLRMGGVAVGAAAPAETQSAWRQVLEILARSGARPLVDRIFPLEEIKPAFRRLIEGPMGKVLVKMK